MYVYIPKHVDKWYIVMGVEVSIRLHTPHISYKQNSLGINASQISLKLNVIISYIQYRNRNVVAESRKMGSIGMLIIIDSKYFHRFSFLWNLGSNKPKEYFHFDVMSFEYW